MPTDRFSALTYLRTPLDAPWRWEENGRTLVWKDGTTLAFREEIQLILERFTVTGAPPFTGVVCVLAACRQRFMSFPTTGVAPTTARTDLNSVLTRRTEQTVLQQLGALSKLPTEIIGAPRGKALLVQIVLEAQTRGPLVDANGVLRGLALGLTDRELNDPDGAPALNAVPTMHSVTASLSKFTPESLQQRLKTGLDALPAPIDPELLLPRSERTRRLFAALAESEEHPGLTTIVRDLMAAIRLPNVLSRFDEQALGGASGLINRGSLDRLLLSELAHDDTTLATRVALNEALYVNREPPAHRPRRALAVLLDTGLRLWGIPRVLATATGLALVSRWPDDCAATAFNHDGAALNELDLLNAEALTSHLTVLNPALDPSDALPAFDARLTGAKDIDAVIVTHRETVNNPAFRARLMRLEFDRGFLVLVDHDGSVQLHSLPWSEKRALAQVQVDVEQLFKTRKSVHGDAPNAASTVPLAAPEATVDLPAIFREKRFPLLVSVQGKIECSIALGDGGICAMADRRLLQWNNPTEGAHTLLTEMPGGRTEWLAHGENGEVFMVRGRDGSGRMAVIILNRKEGTLLIARIPGPRKPQAVIRRHNVLMLVLQATVVTVSTQTADVVAETPFREDLTWFSGRYFSGANKQSLWVMTWDGANVGWSRIERHPKLMLSQILLPFDRKNIGPWLLMKDGFIFGPNDTQAAQFKEDFDTASIDLVGENITVSNSGKRVTKIIRVDELALVPLSEGPTRPVPPTRSMLVRMKAIGSHPKEGLKLNTIKDERLVIFGWRWSPGHPAQATRLKMIEFTTMQTPLALGCTLRVATWPNGSKAWMDNRGFLHLRSHDTSIPEVTLTLGVGGPLGAWTSAGHLIGGSFFIGKQSVIESPKPILGIIARFCAALC